MSLKPPKKSDLGKSWMKNRRDNYLYNICPTALHRSDFPDSVLLPSAYRQVPGNPA